MLQAASLAGLTGIRHAFFTRQGGVSQGIYESLNGGLGSQDAGDNVTENRTRMAAALGTTPDRLLTAFQIHSPDVAIVEQPWARDARPKADAVVTRVPGLAVAVTTADCGPILLADPDAGVVAAAHAGWRGALAGVIEATFEAMQRCGAERSRIIAALGPMIRQGNYEVGPDFIKSLQAADRANERFLRPATRPDHGLFDLPGYIAARLAAAGVSRIEDSGRCTYAEPEMFYSYRRATHRRETDYGRHVSAIVLTG